jgi:hypothetical protein
MKTPIVFKTEPHYFDLPNGRTRQLLNDVVIHIDGWPLIIPAGFLTDGASVPRFLWPIFPPFGRYNKASLLHDYLYHFGRICSTRVTRKQADDLFLDAMEVLGVSFPTRWAMWAGVRVGAFPAWNNYRRDDVFREEMGFER